MKESDRKKKLENLKGLEKIDVTKCAEDNEQLKQKFQDKVYFIVVLSYLKTYKVKFFSDSLLSLSCEELNNYRQSDDARTQPTNYRDRYKTEQRRERRQIREEWSGCRCSWNKSEKKQQGQDDFLKRGPQLLADRRCFCKIYHTRVKEARGSTILASIRLHNFHTQGNENCDKWKVSGPVWQCNQYFLAIVFFQSFENHMRKKSSILLVLENVSRRVMRIVEWRLGGATGKDDWC